MMKLDYVTLSLCLWFAHTATSSIQTCDVKSEFRPDTIILARETLDAGGRFLNRVRVNSMHDCYHACCELSSCTSAIYQSKSPEYCFLFDCANPDSCVYGKKTNHDLILMSDRSQHRAVHLSEQCDRRSVCDSPHSVCSDGRCICQSGWLQKGSECVPSVCKSPNLQFQCNDSSTCVAIYDRCNGIVECPDASDESNCPVAVTTRPTSRLSKNVAPGQNTSTLSEKAVNLTDHTPNFSTQQKGPWDRSRFDRGLRSDLDEPVYRHRVDDFKSEEPELVNGIINSDEEPVRGYLHRPRGRPFDDFSNSPDEDWHPTSDVTGPMSTRRHFHPSYAIDPSSVPQVSDPLEDDDESFWRRRLRPSGRRHRRHSKPYTVIDPSYDLDEEAYDQVSEDFDQDHIVDPSVYRIPHSWSQAHGRRGRTGHYLVNDRPSNHVKTKSEHQVSASSDKKITGSTTPSNLPSPDVQMLSVLQQNQKQSHTAALVLAFSLGLVCCFMGLLFVEWRRRTNRRTWTIRRRPARITVPFTERDKPSTIPSHHNKYHQLSVEDEDAGKPLYNGQVL